MTKCSSSEGHSNSQQALSMKTLTEGVNSSGIFKIPADF